MGRDDIGKGIGILTILVAAIILLALAIQRAGLGPLLSIMAALATVLTFVCTVFWKVLPESNQPNETGTEPAARRGPRRLPAPSVGESESPPSTADHAQEIIRNPEWRHAGSVNFPNRTVAHARTLTGVLERLPISERGVQWGYRSVLATGVLALFWLVMVFLRVVGMVSAIELPAELRSLAYAVAVPSFSPLFDLFVYIALPTLVIVGVLAVFVVRSDSTCPACDESFALTNKGTYYRDEGKTSRSKTKNDTEYTWIEYDGTQVLRCTDCGEWELRETSWDDQSPW